jgi:predicted transcriptional regulator
MWYLAAVEKTTLYLSPELHSALRSIARRTGRAQADLIREALAAYISTQERPVPRSIGAASDGTLPSADAKAWVRDQWADRDRRRER